jgi:hypothetical protein
LEEAKIALQLKEPLELKISQKDGVSGSKREKPEPEVWEVLLFVYLSVLVIAGVAYLIIWLRT